MSMRLINHTNTGAKEATSHWSGGADWVAKGHEGVCRKGYLPPHGRSELCPEGRGSAPPQKIFQKFEVRVHFGAVLQHLWMFLVEISLRLTLLLSLCSIPNVSYWDIASYYWQACVLVVQKSVFRHAGATHCQITRSSGQKCGNTAPKNSQNF